MGAPEDDESEFRPRRRMMDASELNVEVARLRERDKSHEAKGVGHDEQFKAIWLSVSKIEERLRNVEVKIAVIAFSSALGGGAAGTILSNWLNK